MLILSFFFQFTKTKSASSSQNSGSDTAPKLASFKMIHPAVGIGFFFLINF